MDTAINLQPCCNRTMCSRFEEASMHPSLRGIGVLIGTMALTCTMTAAAHSSTAQIGQVQFSIVYHSGKPTKSVTLTCLPTGGDHPDGEAACADMIAASGDVARIPPARAACLAYLDPVTADAVGFWNGRFITYSKEFTNEGCARVATGGHVFNF
ncbi:MAG TPA: SSI family serine proteinase inhibitor [Streptosporangiaceae bacterium]|nr:SSI family serine proteinase inhibitor [Streptosporangiaceae bacterium]